MTLLIVKLIILHARFALPWIPCMCSSNNIDTACALWHRLPTHASTILCPSKSHDARVYTVVDALQDRADVPDEQCIEFFWADCCSSNEAQEPSLTASSAIGAHPT